VPELRTDMTEEDAVAAAAQLAHDLRRAEESREPRCRTRGTRNGTCGRGAPTGVSSCRRTAWAPSTGGSSRNCTRISSAIRRSAN
jgi:hypothetical protein